MKTLDELNLSPLIAVVDIETLAKTPNAKIGAIGVVLVDVIKGCEAGRFYTPVCLDSQPQRVEEQSTVEWLENQREAFPDAYNQMYAEDIERMSLASVLEAVAAFLRANFGDKKIQLMGNGPEFDNVILAHAYEEAELEQPWHYAGNQSLRTVVWLGRVLLGIDPKYDGDFIGTKHHALHDAAHEARYLLGIIQELRRTIGWNK
ncbi:3'-5' exonuclease [Vibrio parahaemolyticus]|uniref:3'-5' exonuclease n=1 Tax=Vibrio parahaemolyticus TaxID=670 RepID=UPI0011218873|nr:3'-5' exonuclease [Vibrio parahaemolyticus]TPB41770.1 3'-5' exoribonuclease [Vibrio parahaemolyticus]